MKKKKALLKLKKETVAKLNLNQIKGGQGFIDNSGASRCRNECTTNRQFCPGTVNSECQRITTRCAPNGTLHCDPRPGTLLTCFGCA